MEGFRTLTSNYIVNVGFCSWVIAQIIKTILVLLSSKKFVPERLFGAGGMPSSHSALVCSMVVAMSKKTGFASPEFALALIFAMVVMYDAMGVRRAAGEQAKVLNKIVFGFAPLTGDDADDEKCDSSNTLLRNGDDESPFEDQKALKEFLGHTPLEVLAGVLLGILIAMLTPAF